jgi:hypothetical protein
MLHISYIFYVSEYFKKLIAYDTIRMCNEMSIHEKLTYAY